MARRLLDATPIARHKICRNPETHDSHRAEWTILQVARDCHRFQVAEGEQIDGRDAAPGVATAAYGAPATCAVRPMHCGSIAECAGVGAAASAGSQRAGRGAPGRLCRLRAETTPSQEP